MFTSERLKWRKQAADTCPDLPSLKPRLATATASRLVDIYAEHMSETERVFPTKSAFRLWQLGSDLANSILYDFTNRDQLIYRVVGEEIKARFGFNPDGRSYLEFVAPERRASALEAFQHCADTPCAMHVRIRQHFESGRRALCEVVGVPLADNPGEATARYLLFVDKLVEDEDVRVGERGVMLYAQIVSRCFVDIGFGVPGDFKDLVPR